MRACKICEITEVDQVADEVCAECTRYDWGHWHIRSAEIAGFFFGALGALGWALYSNYGGQYRFSAIAVLFFSILGGIAGRALVGFLADRVFQGVLTQAEPADTPGDRYKEAEKFYYISLLSARQGKTRFALSMLEQARRHGWQSWDGLTADPRLRHFTRLDRVQSITSQPPRA